MGTVIDPFAGSRDPLAGRNGGRIAHHSHDLAMAARFGSQNAEAVLDVVISDALNQPGQDFLG
jgi:hypothetical protein